MFKKILVLSLLIGLISCSSRITEKSRGPESSSTIKKNQILFLSLEASKSNRGIDFVVMNTKLVDGRLKSSMPTTLDLSQYLILEFLASDGKVITRVASENPLNRSVEVSSEEGRLERKQIEMAKGSFTLRIQFDKDITSVKISDNNGKSLSTLPLAL